MYRVFLGLGSNLGDRVKHLTDALGEISRLTTIKAVSSVYKTAPYNMKSEHEFLNISAEVETSLEPPVLLHKLKLMEHKLGRTSHSHMKDREIDIDILLYENLYYEAHTEHSIEVPHSDVVHRRFVLTSLNDIASQVIHPVEGESIHTLLQRCVDQSKVERTTMQLHFSSSQP